MDKEYKYVPPVETPVVYTEKKVREMKNELLQTIADHIMDMENKHKEKAYKPGHLDLVEEARYFQCKNIRALVIGFIE